MEQQYKTLAKRLAQVYNALDTMEVKGFSNVSALAAAMSELRNIYAELRAGEAEPVQSE